MHHVFVDYENIKTVDPAIFELEPATFTLLLGPQNRALDVGVVEMLMTRAATVELVRLEASGRNAVDFALVYYLGRKVAADAAAEFHLISKDKGYDPLIAHLQGRNVRVSRHDNFDGLTGSSKVVRSSGAGSKMVRSSAERDPVTRVLQHLRRNANSRPKREKTLVRQLASQFLKGSAPAEVEQLIKTLVESGYLRIDAKGAITYELDTERTASGAEPDR